MTREMRLELIQVPVWDIDRAKSFYVDKVGFTADHDHQVSEELRFVQLTAPGCVPMGSFVFFEDPDGNGWALQALTHRE